MWLQLLTPPCPPQGGNRKCAPLEGESEMCLCVSSTVLPLSTAPHKRVNKMSKHFPTILMGYEASTSPFALSLSKGGSTSGSPPSTSSGQASTGSGRTVGECFSTSGAWFGAIWRICALNSVALY